MDTPIIIQKPSQDNLAGQLLIATPQLQDDFFKRAVIYMCEHTQDSALGIIVNAPIERLNINQILEQMQTDLRAGDRKMPVMFGGPVEAHRGFVLHNGVYLQETALSTCEGVTVSANVAVLTGWLEGNFAAKAMLALGYAGWSPGQLESEIEAGSWMVVPASESFVFDTPAESKWDVAIASLGFDMGNLSSTVGHA